MTPEGTSSGRRRRSYSSKELAELAAGIRRTLASIAAGDIDSDRNTVLRLEGAVAALEALADGKNVT